MVCMHKGTYNGRCSRRLVMEILQNPPCFAAVNEEREGSRRLVRRRRALVLRGEEDGRPRVVRSRRLESTACGSGCARKAKISRQKLTYMSQPRHFCRHSRPNPSPTFLFAGFRRSPASRCPAGSRRGRPRCLRRAKRRQGYKPRWPRRRREQPQRRRRQGQGLLRVDFLVEATQP
jgi:hypothetical protein